MLSKKWFTLALLIVLCLYRGNLMAEPSKKPDVRTMQDWSIVVADTAIESERYAAEEFRDFFAQATGHLLAIRSGGPSGTNNVFIGASDALRKSNLAHALDREYAEEELRVIIGLDNVAIVGGRPRGVLYGVYQFLEDAMGVRFLAKDYTHVPRYAADDPVVWTWPDMGVRRGQLAPTDYSYNPPLECRFVGFGDFQERTGQFAARLRMNGRWSGNPVSEEVWRKRLGGHNLKGLILHSVTPRWVKASPEDHPEYFGVDKDGKRLWNDQPCFSNPEMVGHITKNILAALERYGPNGQIAVAHMDGPLCHCKRCEELVRQDGREPDGASWGAPMFLAVNHIARDVAKVRPDLTVATYAYTESNRPPLSFKMEPNVRIQYTTYSACQIHPFESLTCAMNMRQRDEMRTWGEISDGMMYWYYGMGSYTDFFAPPLALRMAGPHLRTLIDNNGKSFFIQGDPIMFAELVQYVFAKLLWDPRLDTFELVNEYVDLYYGPSAGPITEFMRLADNELRRANKHVNCNVPNIFKEYGYTQELGWRGIELFNEALELAETPEVKARVEKASLVPYRMTLGVTWLGQTPEGMTDEDRTKHRQSARKVFELCRKLNITVAHEARNMESVEGAIRKALGMEENEPF